MPVPTRPVFRRSRHRTVARGVVLGSLLLMLAGCDSQQAAWEQAEETDTAAAYQQFLEEHPDADQAAVARDRIAGIEREAEWERARSADTLEAYREFQENHPDTDEAAQASERIAELEPQMQWETLRDTTSQAALRAFVERYPGHPASAEARQRISDLEEAERAEQERERAEQEARQQAEEERERTLTHRVQLAAFRTEEQAQAAVTSLGERHSELLEDTGLEFDRAGNYFRLRTAPMEQQAAGELCERLKGRGQDCLVVTR